MDILLIVLSLLNIISIIFFVRATLKKYKTHGKIRVIDKGQMYIELNDIYTESEIRNSRYAIFEVVHTRK